MKDNSGVSLLANRYASAAMREIFAPEAKIIAERKLWKNGRNKTELHGVSLLKVSELRGHGYGDLLPRHKIQTNLCLRQLLGKLRSCGSADGSAREHELL